MTDKKFNFELEKSNNPEMLKLGEVINTSTISIACADMIFGSYKKMNDISITERMSINYDEMLKNDSKKYHTWLKEGFIYKNESLDFLGNYVTPIKEVLRLDFENSIHEWIEFWCIKIDDTNIHKISKENFIDLTTALLKEEFNVSCSFEIISLLSNILNNFDFDNDVLIYERSL